MVKRQVPGMSSFLLASFATILQTASAGAQESGQINFLSRNDESCAIYPQFNAEAFGFWQQEEISVSLLSSDTGTAYTSLLQDGTADIVVLDSDEILHALNDELPIRVVYEANIPPPDSVIVKAESPIESLADLKGKTFVLSDERSRIPAQLAFESAGLSLNDVQSIVLGTGGPVMAAALSDPSFDAAIVGPADRRMLESTGILYRDITPPEAKAVPGYSFVVWGPTIEEKRNKIQKFLKGWAMAQHAGLVDPTVTTIACLSRMPEQFQEMGLVQEIVDAAVGNNQLRFGREYGGVELANWANIQRPYLALGELKKTFDPSSFIDTSFIAGANAWTTAEVQMKLDTWQAANLPAVAPELQAVTRAATKEMSVAERFVNLGPISRNLKATRAFAGPHSFPPKGFAAYGIVAFPAVPSNDTRDRFLMICEAFVSAIPPSSASDLPPPELMVTVWPLKDGNEASLLDASTANKCETAVSSYDGVTAAMAIENARRAGRETSGQGPFLLAWAPSETGGQPDVLVLKVDMSRVSSQSQATDLSCSGGTKLSNEAQFGRAAGI